MFFTIITTSQYEKALPQSALAVLWPYPLCFSFDRPDWGPRTLGWGTALGTVACRAGRCAPPWSVCTARPPGLNTAGISEKPTAGRSLVRS